MSDPLRDMLPYFKTWLVFATSKLEDFARNRAKDVGELEEKLASANRCLVRAKEERCMDLVEEFADIVVRIEELFEQAKKKREKLD